MYTKEGYSLTRIMTLVFYTDSSSTVYLLTFLLTRIDSTKFEEKI